MAKEKPMKKVLIAEDNRNFGSVLKRELEDERFLVDLVTDGVEAVMQFVEDQSYSLIICDIMMPRLNGIDAVHIIKKLRPNVFAITFSGNLSHSDKADSYSAGAIACFAKPFEIAKLKECILQHIDRHEKESMDNI